MELVNMRKEVGTYIAARYPIIAVRTIEERRAEVEIAAEAESRGMAVRLWSAAIGFCDLDDSKQEPVQDPLAALTSIVQSKTRTLFILRDFHPFIDPSNPSNVINIRMMRELGRVLKNAKREQARTVVLLGPKLELPDELRSEVVLVDWPLPTLEEISATLEEIVERLPAGSEMAKNIPADRTAIAASAQGLTLDEAANCFARSLVMTKTLDPRVINAEKKQVVARSGAVEWLDPLPGGLDNIGGLDDLKEWAIEFQLCFGQKALDYGLSAPKGVLIIGVPGTGKSYAVGCLAETWGMPLLATSADRMSGGLVGESEGKTRQVFQTSEAVSPCILRFDELEKLFAGSTGSGEADGGTKKAVLGMTLSWMQEKKKPVFVAATANEIDSLPPELIRKGRFDEVFFVDLPNVLERAAIWRVHFIKRKRDPSKFDLVELATKSDLFTGAEIEAALEAGMRRAFSRGKEVEMSHIVAAIGQTVPLAKTAAEKIEKLRAWAKGKARMASKPMNSSSSSDRFAELG
jgi:hypothetical protein